MPTEDQEGAGTGPRKVGHPSSTGSNGFPGQQPYTQPQSLQVILPKQTSSREAVRTGSQQRLNPDLHTAAGFGNSSLKTGSSGNVVVDGGRSSFGSGGSMHSASLLQGGGGFKPGPLGVLGAGGSCCDVLVAAVFELGKVQQYSLVMQHERWLDWCGFFEFGGGRSGGDMVRS